MLVFFAMVILLLVMVLTFIVRPLMWPGGVDDVVVGISAATTGVTN